MSGDTTLDRWPRPAELGEYDSAAELIEGLLLELPGIVSVYRTGSVLAPGISDLDRIAVVRGCGPFSLQWKALPEGIRYIAMHTPFLVDTETFSQHKWFAHLEPLHRVVGEEIAFVDPPESETLAQLLGIEGLLVLRLKLEKQRFTRRIKVRPLLCELNNLRHCLRLARVTQSQAAEAWAVAGETAALRSSWWQIETPERTRRIIDLAYSAAPAIDGALAASGHTVWMKRSADGLALAAPYANVFVTSVEATSHAGVGLALPAGLTRLSRRGAEARWRLTHHTLEVPREICSLIGRASSGEGLLLQQRHARVMRYRDFLGRTERGWSSIGFAQAFAKS